MSFSSRGFSLTGTLSFAGGGNLYGRHNASRDGFQVHICTLDRNAGDFTGFGHILHIVHEDVEHVPPYLRPSACFAMGGNADSTAVDPGFLFSVENHSIFQ
jgi:hypothetical protein